MVIIGNLRTSIVVYTGQNIIGRINDLQANTISSVNRLSGTLSEHQYWLEYIEIKTKLANMINYEWEKLSNYSYEDIKNNKW